MTTKYNAPISAGGEAAGGLWRRAAPFPQSVMEACYNAANEICAEISRSNPPFKKMLDSLTAYRSDFLSMHAGGRAVLRQLHDGTATRA